MWPFSSKVKTTRSTIDGAAVQALISAALKGGKASNYRHIAQNAKMAVITMTDVERASAKSFSPWVKDAWEREDIARSMIDAAQRMAANEGLSWAIGTLRSEGPGDDLHIYVWAIIHQDGGFGEKTVVFYDPTTRSWSSAANLSNVDFTMT